MSKKIAYEKPVLIDLTGSDEVHGASNMCGKGGSATGSCSVGDTALPQCLTGKNAIGVYCGVGQVASGQCYQGPGIRHS